MIQKPTLLILGAGASYAYGFPLGPDLITLIQTLDADSIYPDLADYWQDRDEFPNFKLKLKSSNLNSIDAFIAAHPKYEIAAKLSIATVLSKCENVALNRFQISKLEDHWYKYLWNRLFTPKKEDIFLNNLRVLTFNYDESLENFLYISFMNSYQSAVHSEAIDFVNKLEITHIFGSIGGGPDLQGRKFGQELGPSSHLFNQEVISGIKTIGEASSIHSQTQLKISEAIRKAERIVILGLSYHEENLTILGLPKSIETIGNAAPKQLICSGFGEKRAKLDSIVKYLRDRPPHTGGWPCPRYIPIESLHKHACLSFLEESGALLD